MASTLIAFKSFKEGYIYPKENRGLRELLRRRLLLVRQQTMLLLSIQNMICRYENIHLSSDKIKRCATEETLSHLKQAHVQCAAQSELKVLKCLVDEIKVLEKTILKEREFKYEVQLMNN